MASYAPPYALRYAGHCFNRAPAQQNRPALIPAGGKLGVTSRPSFCQGRTLIKTGGKSGGHVTANPSDRVRTAKDIRLFVEAVLWLARTGSPWRDLPTEFGNWHSTYVRFARWRDAGVWDRIAFALAGERDLARVFIDSTIVRAHQHASGAQKK